MTIKRSGFTTAELMVYVTSMVLVLASIVYLLFRMYALYTVITIGPRVDRVGVAIVDRIIKDIRTGTTVNLAESEFNSSTGEVQISTQENDVTVTKTFAYDNGRITYQEDVGDTYFLSPEDMSVSQFRLELATSSISEAIRVELDITYEQDNAMRTKSFIGFGILRHSYE